MLSLPSISSRPECQSHGRLLAELALILAGRFIIRPIVVLIAVRTGTRAPRTTPISPRSETKKLAERRSACVRRLRQADRHREPPGNGLGPHRIRASRRVWHERRGDVIGGAAAPLDARCHGGAPRPRRVPGRHSGHELLLADGWIGAGYHFVWQIALFLSLAKALSPMAGRSLLLRLSALSPGFCSAGTSMPDMGGVPYRMRSARSS